MQLIVTKLRKLALPPDVVVRPRLVEKLDRGLKNGKLLTLVSAPAGYGKTTLLTEWLQDQESTTGWLHLDEADNDVDVFFSYFLAALCNAGLELPDHLNETALVRNLDRVQLVPLINHIENSHQRHILVLDDYHEISAKQIHEALTFLIEQQPVNLHLVISTRADPPLPIVKCRASGLLTEIRSHDLKFTQAETSDFFADCMQLDLKTEEIDLLEARTEGWIVGLKLAAISLRDRPQRSGFIHSFSGTHRFILDYLTDEVLDRQGELQRSFLLLTSILPGLHADLCDVVMQRDDSAEILQLLVEKNLFLVALDDEHGWYRYHALFADLLAKQLPYRMASEVIEQAHRRAGGWYDTNGYTREAIKHYLKSGDHHLAAENIEKAVAQNRHDGRLSSMLLWAETLPEDLLLTRPRLVVYYTWALFLAGNMEGFRVWLKRASDSLNQGGGEREPEDSHLHIILEIMRTLARSLQNALSSDMNRSIELAQSALELAREIDDVFLQALAYEGLALGHFNQGRLHDAIAYCQEMIAVVAAQGGHSRQQLPLAAMGHAEMARVHLEWNNLGDAQDHLEQAIELSYAGGGSKTLVEAFVILAELKIGADDLSAAAEIIEEAESVYDLRSPRGLTSFRLETSRVLLDIARAMPVQALRRIEIYRSGFDALDRPLPETFHEKLEMLAAKAELTNGQAARAAGRMEKLIKPASEGGRTSRLLTILWLLALALLELGEKKEAFANLQRSLEIAEPGGYQRLYLGEGEAGATLLAEFSSRQDVPDASRNYARQLLSEIRKDQAGASERPARSHGRGSDLPEALTARELDVLELICSGLSNQEIAEALVISINTVKRHTSNIYGKLGVSGRSQAIRIAHQLGLIDPQKPAIE